MEEKRFDTIKEHNIITIKEIDELTKLLIHIVTIEKKRVLLVCDIDDTLIRPVVNIGSDAWFRYSLQSEDVDDVINKLAIIYAVLNFQGVENLSSDTFVETIGILADPLKYQNSLKYMCLTARNVRFHSYSTTHLHKTRYDKVLVRRNMLDLPDDVAMYMMDDKHNRDRNVPLVRYIDNICSTSGKDKGIVLKHILNSYFLKHPEENFDLVIIIDDLKENIDKIHDNLKTEYADKFSCLCVHYTYMEEHKNNYSIHQFTDDTAKMNHLIELTQYINNDKK